jgi:GMP synthase (glutamine-hydrolysing)
VSVHLVVTEHASRLDEGRRRGYGRVQARLAEVCGGGIQIEHYRDVRDLGGAEAIVLSGSSAPWAAHERKDIERLGDVVARSGRPVLGICAGMQLLAMVAGGEVRPMSERGALAEHGYHPIEVLDDSDLLRSLPAQAAVFHDHRDEVTVVPEAFRVLARTPGCPVQAFADTARRWWGTQFHPERWDLDRPAGERVLRNFFELAG